MNIKIYVVQDNETHEKKHNIHHHGAAHAFPLKILSSSLLLLSMLDVQISTIRLGPGKQTSSLNSGDKNRVVVDWSQSWLEEEQDSYRVYYGKSIRSHSVTNHPLPIGKKGLRTVANIIKWVD